MGRQNFRGRWDDEMDEEDMMISFKSKKKSSINDIRRSNPDRADKFSDDADEENDEEMS